MVKLIACLSLVFSLLTVGCVSVNIPEPLPDDTDLNVSVNIQWKSNVGENNAIDQKTDARLPLSPLMQEQ